ncbi:MAG: AAA domain-containing protein [Bacteroidetes bacterium]|jgi:5-methylcytosine-specific restriction enzyme B|nr:AAA domain-containing protein [Bacteroidota bacterium]
MEKFESCPCYSEQDIENHFTETGNKFWHTKVALKTIKFWLKKGDFVFITDNRQNIIKSIAQIESDYYYDDKSPINLMHFRKVKWILNDVSIPVSKVYETRFSSYSASLLYSKKVNKSYFLNSTAQETKNFVLIIDEINRGNIANIFGELITLLEPAKRVGGSEELLITLPYSKQPFSVPQNLYIIGTMNTADRSVEALDTALRRRFSFTEYIPDVDLLIDNLGEHLMIGKIDIYKLLESINKRIEKLLDKDHCIGHSYFLSIQENNSLEHLKSIFADKIIPLLTEYFYGDFGKIGLILGEDFILTNKDEIEFANFNYPDKELVSQREIYSLLNIKELKEDSFIKIYNPKYSSDD